MFIDCILKTGILLVIIINGRDKLDKVSRYEVHNAASAFPSRNFRSTILANLLRVYMKNCHGFYRVYILYVILRINTIEPAKK